MASTRSPEDQLIVMKVTIDLPDRPDLDVDETYAREALIATLYSTGKLTG